jgi:hypothetical protein
MRQEPRSPDTDSATRQLCAGVYLDSKFRDSVIRRVHNDPRHRVAPSYGFDLVPVVDHARRAWMLDRGYQVGLALVCTTGLLTNPAAAVMAGCAIGFVPLFVLLARKVPQVIGLKVTTLWHKLLRRRGKLGADQRLVEGARLVRVGATGCVVLAAIPVVIAYLLGTPLNAVIPAAAAMLLLAAILAVTAGVVRQRALNGLGRAESLRPGKLTKRLQVIDEQQSHPFVVYAKPKADPEDDDLPKLRMPDQVRAFVGCGQIVHQWRTPLVVLLVKPGDEPLEQREFSTPPFTAHEFVAHLRNRMAPLGHLREPTHLPGFESAHRIYVAETRVPSDRDFLTRPPTERELNDLIDNPHGISHHYLEFRATSSGEVVTTVLLEVTVQGRALSINLTACALTPPPDEFQKPDRFKETGPGAVVRAGLRGLRELPASAGRLWQLADVPKTLAGAAWAVRDRTAVPRLGVLIGTKFSVREENNVPWEEARANRYRSTVFDHALIIEQRVFRLTEAFLSDHGVDTSDFEKHEANIISTSIYNTGQMTMQGSSIGTGNQSQAAAALAAPTFAAANAAANDPRTAGGLG